MKILAVNGSPRGAQGNTEVILQAFLAGAQQEGAKTEVLYLKDKNIKHCIGCFTCWTKTPGVCVHKDDMPAIMEMMKEQDIMVYAMPLYVFTVPGLFKDYMDRLIPFAQPLIEKRGDHYIHPPRWGGGLRRSVLISNAGFSESHHFDGLKRTFELLNDGPDNELLGTICCAAGPLLSIPEFKAEAQIFLDAAYKAGAEVVRDGRISPDLQTQLNRSLAPDSEAYANMVNAYWGGLGVDRIDEVEPDGDTETKEAPADNVLTPSGSMETIRDLVSSMPLAFNGEAAGDLEAVFQFDVTDEDPGDYYIAISGGTCTAYAGIHANPNATIRTPADVWLKISRGEMNGATAFMTGKYKVTGNLQLLMKMEKLFSRPA
jgi:putative sterol carrier protein